MIGIENMSPPNLQSQQKTSSEPQPNFKDKKTLLGLLIDVEFNIIPENRQVLRFYSLFSEYNPHCGQ